MYNIRIQFSVARLGERACVCLCLCLDVATITIDLLRCQYFTLQAVVLFVSVRFKTWHVAIDLCEIKFCGKITADKSAQSSKGK